MNGWKAQIETHKDLQEALTALEASQTVYENDRQLEGTAGQGTRAELLEHLRCIYEVQRAALLRLRGYARTDRT